MAPWTNKTGLAKAATILATVLGVSLGLCGLNIVASTGNAPDPLGLLLFIAAFPEGAGIFVGAIGLVLVALFAILKFIAEQSNIAGMRRTDGEDAGLSLL